MNDNNVFKVQPGGDLVFKIPDGLVPYVWGGEVTLHLTASAGSYEALFSVTRPHPRLGLGTIKKYYGEDLLPLIGDKLKVTPIPSRGSPSDGPTMTPVSSLARAREIVRSRDLMHCVVNGVTTALPEASLDERDFESRRGLADVAARLFCIAEKTGTATLIGRIRSLSELHIPQAKRLSEWWDASTPIQRIRLLSGPGKMKNLNGPLFDKIVSMMTKCPQPFREDAALLEEYQGEDERNEEVSSGVDLGFAI